MAPLQTHNPITEKRTSINKTFMFPTTPALQRTLCTVLHIQCATIGPAQLYLLPGTLQPNAHLPSHNMGRIVPQELFMLHTLLLNQQKGMKHKYLNYYGSICLLCALFGAVTMIGVWFSPKTQVHICGDLQPKADGRVERTNWLRTSILTWQRRVETNGP